MLPLSPLAGRSADRATSVSPWSAARTSTRLLAERLPVTGELVALAFVVSLALAIPVALLAAHRPNGVFDRISMVVATTGLSVANYVLALILVLIFAVNLGWLPAIGFVPLSEGPWPTSSP